MKLIDRHKILATDFDNSLNMIAANADKLKLGRIQRRRYFEAFATIRNYRSSFYNLSFGLGAETEAFRVIDKYENKK